MITIYTSTYNDEIMIPHMMKWYRDRFPNCRISVGDNGSTDRTKEICLSIGCDFRPFDSGNTIPVEVGLWFKNNLWREKTNTDWIVVVDCDEFLDITQKDLEKEEKLGTTIIRTQGWDVYNLKDDLDVEGMICGSRNKLYDKLVCFNKKKINAINFGVGSHSANPEGIIKFSETRYNLLHKKYVNVDYVFEKYQQNMRRIPDFHSERGYAFDLKEIGKVPASFFYNQDKKNVENEFLKHRKLCIPLKIRSL